MSQPTHITNIALVGATGQVGSHVLRHLQSAATKFDITIVSREDSKADFPSDPNTTIQRVNYTDHSSLISALSGAQFLIISLSVFAPKETQQQLIDAAAATGTVKYIIPNEWGTDWTDPEINKAVMIGDAIVANREYIVSKGMSWISVSCGFWYEYSLGSGSACYGFDLRNVPGKVYLFDGGDTPVNTSTWNHVGEGVEAMLRLPIHAADGGDTGKQALSIEGTFKNSFLRLSSFTLTQRDMLASLARVTSTDPKSWTTETVATEKWLAQAREELAKGSRLGFGKILYGTVMQAVEGKNEGYAMAYQAHKGLHDQALGLKGEDLDEATLQAVRIAEEKIREGNYWA